MLLHLYRSFILFLNQKVKLSCFLMVGTFLLSSCATDTWQGQENMQLETNAPAKLQQIATMQDKLDRIGGKLLIDNVAFCHKQLRNVLGFSVANKYSYSENMSDLAHEVLGLTDRLRVTNVIEGSGAEKAGLRSGDILLKIEDHPVPRGNMAESNVVAMLSELVANNQPVHLMVYRDKSGINMTIPLTPACGFRIELGKTGSVNAFSDGSRIMITQGMMLYASSDENIAFVIAKEMAHNVLDHHKTLNNTKPASVRIDNIIQTPPKPTVNAERMRAMPARMDVDADSLSLAMLLRSGYDIDNAPSFWKKLALHFPAKNPRNYTALHPASATRMRLMNQSIPRIKAIDSKRRALIQP